MQPNVTDLLVRNLASVRQRITLACTRAGRPPEDVRLLAVTKYVEAPVVDALAGLGQLDVGENYVVRALEKMAQCATDTLRWHLIGHLQGNKVRKVVGHVACIQTVDSVKLVGRIGAVASELQLEMPIYLQVNTSAEAAKSGAAPEALGPLAEAALATPGVRLEGLMTMAGLARDDKSTRTSFCLLRELAEETAARLGTPALRLSMGMSGDLELAIEEGATDVRVGSALYEGIREDTPIGAAG